MATVAHPTWRQQPARHGGVPQRAAAGGRERPRDGTPHPAEESCRVIAAGVALIACVIVPYMGF
jgi:hypothetical protein